VVQEAGRIAVAQRQQRRLGLDLVVGEGHRLRSQHGEHEDTEQGDGGGRGERSRTGGHGTVVGIPRHSV
jgi:hypothetical protein